MNTRSNSTCIPVIVIAAAIAIGLAGCSRQEKPAPGGESGSTTRSTGKKEANTQRASRSSQAAQPSASAKTTAPEAKPKETMPYRMCAMTRNAESGVTAGLVNTAGETILVKVGQSTPEGFRLVSADFKKGTATFERNGTPITIQVDSGTPAPTLAAATTPAQPPRQPAKKVTEPDGEDEPNEAPPHPAPADTAIDVVLQTEAGGAVAVTSLPDSPALAQMEAGGKLYVLPRAVAAAILGNQQLTAEQQYNALISFPALTELQGTQDPAAEIKNKEAQMAAELIPPSIVPPPPPTNITIPPLPAAARRK